MAENDFINAERVVSTALGLLLREVTLPRLVWRDAGGDFRGAKDDTISIRVPSYASARTRSLRAGAARTRDRLHERKVDVTLDVDVYKDVPITDEELTLDIESFGRQVLSPVMVGIVEQIEQEVADEITGATYQNSISFDPAADDAWSDLIVEARETLNKMRVPMGGRVLAVGSEIESALLNTDLFVKANESGSTEALTDATLGNKAGFQIVSVPALPPDEAYAFHRTAYVLSSRAPMIPNGAPWGSNRSAEGFALRVVQVLDSDTIENIVATDAYVGTNVVQDSGTIDGTTGVFTPSEDPDASGESTMLVRAVQITTP